MCGICGIYGEGTARLHITSMMWEIKHRGLDGESHKEDQYCALGHDRLAILDLSENGKQPMTNEDGTIWLVVNGEIYNYKTLRSVLKAKGHTFHSESDSEVILHLYEDQGLEFVKGLRGMFALALYDQKQRRLILARDPIGKKPLYYAWQNGTLYFASEIKALFAAGVAKKVNYARIPDYLMYQYVPGEETLFEGVKKLLAGHMLIAKSDGYGIDRYWKIHERGEPEAVDKMLAKYQGVYPGYTWNGQLRDLLDESVSLRLQSDVPVGAFLSGGIDSSAVVALWRKQSNADIHTFTASFPTHSEASYAKQAADHLGTIYHEVSITPEMVASDLERITWHHDEPLGDAATINTYYLAREAKKYVTVVLAGEGGDELFGGYPWYQHAGKIAKLSRIPWLFRMPAIVPLMTLGMHGIDSKYYALGRRLELVADDGRDLMILNTEATMSFANAMWLLQKEYYQGCQHEIIHPNGIRGTYNRMLAMDCLNLLPEKFLMKADKGTMAWGIEERLPLLDKHIIEYAFSLPESQKQDKKILREAVAGLLPNEIVRRPKQGFGTPQKEWLESDALRPMVEERMQDGKLLKEICKPESLRKILKAPANILWTVFALQVWYDVWFGK